MLLGISHIYIILFFYNSDTIYTYTPQGLISKEEVKKSGKVVITKEYTYDKNGNVLKSTVTENGKENYIYREEE